MLWGVFISDEGVKGKGVMMGWCLELSDVLRLI